MRAADFESARTRLRPEEMGGEDSGEGEEEGQAASGGGGGAETGDSAASVVGEWRGVPTAAAQASGATGSGLEPRGQPMMGRRSEKEGRFLEGIECRSYPTLS